MFKKIKNIVSSVDRFLYRKFGSDKSVKSLENIREVQKIFLYLNDIGKETKIRFVGGCVRKALSGECIDDIDLATSLEPHEVKKKLAEKNIKVIDTGILYGTVTVILNKKKFEITTLRKDVSTDGRRANVQFTLDWEQDALRRDFTINAIYADMDGRIFDPLNGISDLKNGNIKFIGHPEERIQEDYLRILRYFRFFIQYSTSEYDEDIIQYIKQNINGLNKISNERIFDELKKILSLRNVHQLFSYDRSKEIILNIFPQFKYYERLNRVSTLERQLSDEYKFYLILALLIVDQSNDYEYFCHKYKISNRIKNRFQNISKNFNNLKSRKFYSEENIKRLIYLTNKDDVKDLLLFSICTNKTIDFSDIKKLMGFVKICEIPRFPISGDYLKKRGYKSGQLMGKKLESLREQWIKNNFAIDKETIEKTLSRVDQN